MRIARALVFLWSLALSFSIAACGQSRAIEEMMMPDEPNFGAACGDGNPCHGGLVCAGGDFVPGGYCTQLCDTNACPEGSTCNSDFGAALCLRTCDTSDQCRDGYQCFRGSCRADCTGDADCGTDGVCNAEGHCEEPDCTSNEQCPEGLQCVSGGRCESVSVIRNEGEACTVAEPCAFGLVCLMASEGGTCAKACDNSEMCDNFDLVCAAVPVDSDGDASADNVDTACLPITESGAFVGSSCASDADCDARLCINGECVIPCHDASDCLNGQSCVPRQRPSVPGNFFGCGFPALLGSEVEYLDIALGNQTVSEGLVGAEALFAVPEDAVSVTLMSRPTSETNGVLSFLEVHDPSRSSVFDLPMIYDYVDQPVRWLPDDNGGLISMLIPNSTPDRVSIHHGRYSVRMALITNETESVDVEVFARVKRAPGGAMTSGTLDLNVFLVTTSLDSTSAPSDGRIQDAFDVLRDIYSSVGVNIGSINYIDVTSTQRSLYSVIDSADSADSELDQMFELSAGQTNNALNIFLVDRIDAESDRESGITLGIAGGIPGAGHVHGTNHSGVAVSISPMIVGGGEHSAELIGQIMGHEIGHYLGLYHNAEGGRACSTGETPSSTNPCVPFAGGDVISDTSHGDTTNLMYWSEMDNYSLSAGQGFVMLRSVLVH